MPPTPDEPAGARERLSARIEAYVDRHTDGVPPLLEELAEETRRATGRLHWSIGKVEGKLLQMLVKIAGARRAVEIGTFTGYSALLIAEALPEDGLLITCEIDRELAAVALRYFGRSPHGRKIRLELGPALQTLSRLPDGETDFVFIDADKPSYGAYFDEALRLLRPGGVVFVDNVFWRGKIFKTNVTNPNARAIAAFNAKVRSETRVEKVMLGVRDGCYLLRKK
jgi:caffeoyl-CoA O-methyltransferase